MSRPAVLHEHLPPPLSVADLRELADVAAGRLAEMPDARIQRGELARRGLVHSTTRSRWDGLEIPAGWALTPAGCAELSAWEARVRDARGPPPGEVADGVRPHRPHPPGHDTQRGSP